MKTILVEETYFPVLIMKITFVVSFIFFPFFAGPSPAPSPPPPRPPFPPHSGECVKLTQIHINYDEN